MLPDQVSEQWEMIRPAIEEALPGYVDRSEKSMSNVLQALLSGTMNCWLLTDGDDVCALGTTIFFFDPLGTRSLFIYSLYGYKPVPNETWSEAFESLKRWAVKKGCSSILAFSDNARVAKIVENLDGDTNTILIRFDLNGRIQ